MMMTYSRASTWGLLGGLAMIGLACSVVVPKPPTPQPPAVKHHTVQVQVTPDGALQREHEITLDVDPPFGAQPECQIEGVALTCHLNDAVTPPYGAHLDIDIDMYQPYHLDFVLEDVDTQGLPPIDLKPIAPPIATFSRQERINAHLVFAGETICTGQYGCQPWFEPAYQTLVSAADREAVRRQKRDKYHDTAIIVECFTNAGHIYDEPGQWLQPVVSRSCEQEPAWFKSLVDEILTEQNPLIPIVVYDGDDGSRGHANAMRQLPVLNALLAGYDNSVVWARFWDGVFYGATPDEIRAFGTAFRATHGDSAVLAIEHNPGHIPAGQGQRDFQQGGNLDAYDVVAGEFDSLAAIKQPPAIVAASYDPEHGYTAVFASDASPWMNIWQILARVNFGYIAPRNQPFDVLVTAKDGPQQGQQMRVSSDSRVPQGSVYLVASPRGPRAYWVFEDGEYEWVRGWVSLADLTREGDYYRATGAPVVDLP